MTANPIVMVVDDDTGVRNAMRTLLKSVGIQSTLYASAQEFLSAYQPTQPGCLVLDIRMPGMSGLELQQRVQGTPSGFPIVFITGHGDDGVRSQALASGAVEVLDKPLDERILLAAIERALDRSRLH